MVYIIPLLVALTFLAAVFGLYTLLRGVPLSYEVPREVKEKTVDYRLLQKEFASYFPQQREAAAKGSPSKGTATVKLPHPLKILGYSRGGIESVLLLAGREKLVLLKGEGTKGWKLLKVGEKYAYLSYRGKGVKLPLPQEKSGIKEPQTVVKTETEEHRLSRALVNRLMADYGQLLSQIDVVPYMENGKTVGFRIRWLQPGSLFAKLGFKVGDVILSVNNIPIKKTEDVFRAVQIIRNEPSIRVKVLRNGKEHYIDIRID